MVFTLVLILMLANFVVLMVQEKDHSFVSYRISALCGWGSAITAIVMRMIEI